MPFESELVVTEHDEMHWRLVEELRYRGNEEVFAVPEGFPTDFASVPRPLWSLIPTYGRYTKAAVLHDYMCRYPDAAGVSRCDADGIFRKVMKELGVGYVRRRMMWAAVRWAGGIAGCGAWDMFLVLLITLLSLPLLIPAAVVLTFQALLWLVEVATYRVRRAQDFPVGDRPPFYQR